MNRQVGVEEALLLAASFFIASLYFSEHPPMFGAKQKRDPSNKRRCLVEFLSKD
jgi:hypothetical protein